MSFRNALSHLFWCVGGIVVGGWGGRCRHGKLVAGWQTQIFAKPPIKKK